AELGLIALLGDLKDDVRAVPLRLVFDKAQMAVRDMPDHLLAGHPFSDLVQAAVKILVAVLELGAELVGTTVDLPRPPSPEVVDGVEDLFGRLVDHKGSGEILSAHALLRSVAFYGVLWLVVCPSDSMTIDGGAIRQPRARSHVDSWGPGSS